MRSGVVTAIAVGAVAATLSLADSGGAAAESAECRGTASRQECPVARTAVSCRRLRITRRVRRGLLRAFKRARGVRHVRGLDKGARYGRCGRLRWAYASFAPSRGATGEEAVRFQDQPDVFRRRFGRAWRDISDTGGACPRVVPRQLRRLWRLEACGQAASQGRARAVRSALRRCGVVADPVARGRRHEVRIRRGRISCRMARRVVRRFLQGSAPPGWHCNLPHNDERDMICFRGRRVVLARIAADR